MRAGDEGRARDSRRMAAALLLTCLIAVVEAIGGWLTHSLALLSDAGHMWTDVSALGLALLAAWFAGRPANRKRTYGYLRLENLSALLNGVLLLAITVFIVVEAIARLKHPAEVHLGPMAVVATIGLVANLVAMAFLHSGHSLNTRSAFLHVLGDALSSVGVLVGAGVMAFTGWPWVDPVISIAISAVVAVGGWRGLREAVDVLLETGPPHVDADGVEKALGCIPRVTAVHDLHIWTVGSGMVALSAHLVVDEPSACENDTILVAAKRALVERFGIDHSTLQIESQGYAGTGAG
ncbi:MAG TPA: cation diffusion facilitator family transporter [Myxococcaceae bacterium]|nr:cation diffusion facilitator family transporter [Myxococcaceae bacterium]